MPINLNIIQSPRNQTENVIYKDLSLSMETGIVKGNDASSEKNFKDLNTSIDFEAIKNSLIN